MTARCLFSWVTFKKINFLRFLHELRHELDDGYNLKLVNIDRNDVDRGYSSLEMMAGWIRERVKLISICLADFLAHHHR